MKSFMFAVVGLTMLGANADVPAVEGAWSYQDKDGFQSVLILADGHYALTTYDLAGKTFVSTRGGKYRADGNRLMETVEFNTADLQQVGTEQSTFQLDPRNPELLIMKDTRLTRIDNGTPGKLAGAWVITGRMAPDGMRKMTPGARRTMKILSGTRFQWIAYNVETKEFSGTGGGTYTTVDGKYTENIEFFSRDNSRVGASLSFDFAIEGTAWRHKGLSSKGDPIDEQWSRRSEIGL
jgi:hypothetical protein